MINWTEIITTLISLTGTGVVGTVLNRKIDKQAKRTDIKTREISNDVTASSQWRELYEKSEEKVDRQSSKIDVLQKDLSHSHRELSDAKNRLLEANFHRCEDHNCMKRIPPTNYIENEKTTNNE